MMATNLTVEDLAELGAALLSSVVATHQAGHVSPAGTLDYTSALTEGPAKLVRDYTIWASGRKTLDPGARERLVDFVQRTGWEAHVLESTAAARNRAEAS